MNELLVSVQSVFDGWVREDWLRSAEVLALVLATWVGGRQLSAMRKEARQDHERSMWDSVISHSLAHNLQLREVRQAVDLAFPSEKWGSQAVPEDQLREAFAKDPELRINLMAFLANGENLALKVAAGVTGENQAYEITGETLVEYVDRFWNYIAMSQRTRPRKYAYLVALAQRWSRLKKRRKNTMFYTF